MNTPAFRLPAEWEPQSAVLVAWPHAGTDWPERLDAVESTYVALVGALARHGRVLVCVADAGLREQARTKLVAAGVDLGRVRFIEIAYDDTWLRDTGPISLVGPGGCVLNDFRFTGWGGKFEASRDDALVEGLVERGLFVAGARHRRIDFALEGGAIESDGTGTILSTWKCLHLRHPARTRADIDAVFADTLGATRVLWLDSGHLEGDDTDAHIDTLARFAPSDTIVHQACDDVADSHHAELARMAHEIAALRTADGRAYRTIALPWPRPIVDDGRRLAASYANYLITDRAVLVPAYGDAADAEAARLIGLAHPGRVVEPIPCRPLIWQNGSLHCVTMQLPAGVLAAN